jgi:hypothetical protein
MANVKIRDDKYGMQQSKLNVQPSKTRRMLLNAVAAVDAATSVDRLLQQNLAVLVLVLYITNVDVVKNLIMGHLDFCCVEGFVLVLSYLHSLILFNSINPLQGLRYPSDVELVIIQYILHQYIKI